MNPIELVKQTSENLLLDVNNLKIVFKTDDGDVTAVNNLNFKLHQGETLGIVGESGSGKSQTAFALMGLLASNGRAEGSAILKGQNILTMSQKDLNKIRAAQMAMIFQDPMTSLNPYMKIGKQLEEVLLFHQDISRSLATKKALDMLDAVKIPEAQKRLSMYPHEFSGGMRQRVMIAMALLCEPQLLIADEPTTALDVTVQAQIMTLLKELQNEFNTAIIMITHDLGVVAGSCDKVLVMYAGQTMEYGSTDDIFYSPSHPYTMGLLNAIPRIDGQNEKLMTIPGNPPNLANIHKGCPFMPRCNFAIEACKQSPQLLPFADNRLRSCFRDVKELS